MRSRARAQAPLSGGLRNTTTPEGIRGTRIPVLRVTNLPAPGRAELGHVMKKRWIAVSLFAVIAAGAVALSATQGPNQQAAMNEIYAKTDAVDAAKEARDGKTKRAGTAFPNIHNSADDECSPGRECSDDEFRGVVANLKAQWIATPRFIRSNCSGYETYPAVESCILKQSLEWADKNPGKLPSWINSDASTDSASSVPAVAAIDPPPANDNVEYDPQKVFAQKQDAMYDAAEDDCVRGHIRMWLNAGVRSRSDLKDRVVQQCDSVLASNNHEPVEKAKSDTEALFDSLVDGIAAEGQ